jgi:hypothetical protein
VHNKDILKNIYKNHFKTVIFYSDYPIIQDDEINYINTHRGFNTHKIFSHFYSNYKSIIDDSDGIFYTMDDNILNVNILNLYDNKKILFYYTEPGTSRMIESIQYSGLDIIDNKSGWWCDHFENGKYGKQAISNLINDEDFKTLNIDKFSCNFSDWFYLPIKYFTEKTIKLFELFSKYEVFLEIAVPSVIHNIEYDKDQYQTFTDDIKWGTRHLLDNKNYVYNSLNHHHNIAIHPIKFNHNPSSKEWLQEFFCKDKCVIITTINKPTEAILKHINNTDYDVIIVGDNKTPDNYKDLHCIYLDIPSQKKLFPELSDLLPYNPYCRKNLGYLYAIKKGYKTIYETDDDNIPYDNFDNILNFDNIQMIYEQNNKWINIFKYFTNNAHIWQRGYPLSLIKTDPNYLISSTNKIPSIINGLVENDPDVDALFRIICNHQDKIIWDKSKNTLINNTNMCVFNTQNTFWINPDLFICLLIPSTVSIRYCDILRGIITNIILKKTDNYMMYTSPNVIQNRNEHNLIDDFKNEYEMYIHNEKILNYIEDNVNDTNITNIDTLLTGIYNNLLEYNVITQNEMNILNIWLKYFNV